MVVMITDIIQIQILSVQIRGLLHSRSIILNKLHEIYKSGLSSVKQEKCQPPKAAVRIKWDGVYEPTNTVTDSQEVLNNLRRDTHTHTQSYTLLDITHTYIPNLVQISFCLYVIGTSNSLETIHFFHSSGNLFLIILITHSLNI